MLFYPPEFFNLSLGPHYRCAQHLRMSSSSLYWAPSVFFFVFVVLCGVVLGAPTVVLGGGREAGQGISFGGPAAGRMPGGELC